LGWCLAAALAAVILMGGPAWAGWRITCIGDSITENHIPWRLERLLEDATGEDWEVLDKGFGGYTSGEIRSSMYSGRWWGDRPRLAFIMAGTNDMIHEYNMETAVGNVRDMVRTMRDRGGAGVVVSWILPSLRHYWTYWADMYNAKLSGSSDADWVHSLPWHQFYNPDTATAEGELMADTVHPTDEGYDLLAEAYFDVVYSVWKDPFVDKVDLYTP
jgi:lysophospholipase L1-like esterase